MNKTEAKDFVEKARKLQTDFRELYNSGLIAIDQDIHVTEYFFRTLRIGLGIKKKDCSITDRDCDQYPYEMAFPYDGLKVFALTEKKPKEY